MSFHADILDHGYQEMNIGQELERGLWNTIQGRLLRQLAALWDVTEHTSEELKKSSMYNC